MNSLHHFPPSPTHAWHFGCSTHVFPPEEFAVLTERGAILESLAAGTLMPSTPEQEHFLRVDREDAAPETVAERAWMRLKGRREFELENQVKAPIEAPDNHGMVEYDADRCWW